MFETKKCEVVICDDDIASIDPTNRRDEIEMHFGKGKTDALFLLLTVLRHQGDLSSARREIFHYAYFSSLRQAMRFGKKLESADYKVFDIRQLRKSRVRVCFSHIGDVKLNSIVEHEKLCLALADAYGGDYDGWETSVETEQPDANEIERKFHLRHPWYQGMPSIQSEKGKRQANNYLRTRARARKWNSA